MDVKCSVPWSASGGSQEETPFLVSPRTWGTRTKKKKEEEKHRENTLRSHTQASRDQGNIVCALNRSRYPPPLSPHQAPSHGNGGEREASKRETPGGSQSFEHQALGSFQTREQRRAQSARAGSKAPAWEPVSPQQPGQGDPGTAAPPPPPNPAPHRL